MNQHVKTFLDRHYAGDALEALKDIARVGGIALAWLNRACFEDELGRPMTEEEWSRISDFGSAYDHFVDHCQNGDDGYVPRSFMRQVMAGCSITTDDDEDRDVS